MNLGADVISLLLSARKLLQLLPTETQLQVESLSRATVVSTYVAGPTICMNFRIGDRTPLFTCPR
jgi:hypothetical protein